MKKGLVSVLLTASMASMLLAGCGGGGEAADTQGQAGAQTGEKQNVQLTGWGAENDQAILKEFADSFAQEYAEYANFDIQVGVES